MAPILRIALMFCALATQAQAQDCSLTDWFSFKDTLLKRNAAHSAYAYVTDHKAVDADGAPNAYHPGDVGKRCLTEAHLGLDCPENAGYPKFDWWSSVIVPDPDNPNIGYVQPAGPFAGFFVTQTWLADPAKPAIDPARYVDSRNVPFLVFPGNKFAKIEGTGFKGDVGVAILLGSGKSTSFVVADQGGGEEARLGEGSIALFTALGGSGINPRNGAGLPAGKVLYVVFPGSRKAAPVIWPRANADLDQQAHALLEAAGGAAAITACFQ